MGNMSNMMKWMLIGCVLVLAISFIWPFAGIQGYGSWLFFGIILLVCLLPMLMMSRKNKNKHKENDHERN